MMQRTAIAAIAIMLGGCTAELGEPIEGIDPSASESTLSRSTVVEPGTGTVFGTGGLGLNVRAAASTTAAVTDWLAEGTTVRIQCQTEGTPVSGTSVWNRIAGGGYVSDAFLYTGYDGFAPGIARCDGAEPAPSPAPSPDPGSTESLRGTVRGTGGMGLNVRSAPSTTGGVVGWLAEGTTVTIACQTEGTWVSGTNVWSFVASHGGYVSDAFVYTGHDGFAPGIARCDGGLAPPPAPPPGDSSSLGAAAVAEARRYDGYVDGPGVDCNQFSSALGNGCVEWCSDFVRYVWGRVGANVSGLTAYSGTFLDYGRAHGTLRTSGPRPGDAVVWCGGGGSPWCKHVGMVTEVSGASFRVIHGNFHLWGDARSAVYESGFIGVGEDVGTGAPIVGFVSPAP